MMRVKPSKSLMNKTRARPRRDIRTSLTRTKTSKINTTVTNMEILTMKMMMRVTTTQMTIARRTYSISRMHLGCKYMLLVQLQGKLCPLQAPLEGWEAALALVDSAAASELLLPSPYSNKLMWIRSL